MNKQRKVVITTTYNEMGIIIDTKVEEVAQPNLQPTCNQLATDTISRQAAIDAIESHIRTAEEPYQLSQTEKVLNHAFEIAASCVYNLPSAQPERKKPVFKTGESVYHVSYADGTGGFEKNKWADWTCPDCGWFVGEQYIPRRHNQQKCNYCAKCGCAIDWSDADMRGEQDERDS